MDDQNDLRQGAPIAPQGADISAPLRRGLLAWFDQQGVPAAEIGRAVLSRNGYANWSDLDAETHHGDDVSQLAIALETAYAPAQHFGEAVSDDDVAQTALAVVPRKIFLDAVEEAVRLTGDRQERATSAEGMRANCRSHVNRVLQQYGSSWEMTDGYTIEWRGDAGVHAAVVSPALEALEDPRFAGARDEFEAALLHLRTDTDKAREDAVDESAKAVESAMKTVLLAHGGEVAGGDKAEGLWIKLHQRGLVADYTRDALLAASRIRNKLGGHGAGEQPREVPLPDALLCLHASAAAIVFLASTLPMA